MHFLDKSQSAHLTLVQLTRSKQQQQPERRDISSLWNQLTLGVDSAN